MCVSYIHKYVYICIESIIYYQIKENKYNLAIKTKEKWEH